MAIISQVSLPTVLQLQFVSEMFLVGEDITSPQIEASYAGMLFSSEFDRFVKLYKCCLFLLFMSRVSQWEKTLDLNRFDCRPGGFSLN